MQRSGLKILLLIAYIVLSTGVLFALTNTNAIINSSNQYTEKTYTADLLAYTRWTSSTEANIFRSAADPNIEIIAFDDFVNTITMDIAYRGNYEQQKMQVFWKNAVCKDYTEENSIFVVPVEKNGTYVIKLGQDVTDLRLDLVENSNVELEIRNIKVNDRSVHFPAGLAIAIIMTTFLLYYILFINTSIRKLMHNRTFLKNLIKNDLKSRYAGSILGIFWAYIQPIMTILVMWFVFQVGFRQSPVGNIPFILWFTSGYITWMYISDTITLSLHSLHEYSYLVKKIKFQVDVLPVLKIVSGLVVHVVFIVFLYTMFFVYGYEFNIMWLQIIYYSVCMIVLLTGLGFLFSALAVFIKDFGQVVGVVLQLMFWISPVTWSPENMLPQYLPVLKANPFFYIIQGYRESMIFHIGFWDNASQTAYFWTVTTVLFVLGTLLFKRMRPHFSDLL